MLLLRGGVVAALHVAGAEVVAERRVLRGEHHGLLVRQDRVLVAVQLHEGGGRLPMVLDAIGLELAELEVGLGDVLVALQALEDARTADEDQEILRAELHGEIVCGGGVPEALELLVAEGERAAEGGVVGGLGGGGLEGGDGLLGAIELQERDGEEVVGLGEVGLEAERALQGGRALVPVLRGLVGDAQLVIGSRVLRAQAHDLLPCEDRVLLLAERLADRAELHPHVGQELAGGRGFQDLAVGVARLGVTAERRPGACGAEEGLA